MRRIFTLLALAALMLAGTALAQDKATYVGSAKCKMCHNKADLQIHTTWMATKHAKALEALTGADEKVTADWAARMKVEVKGPAAKAEACLKCHVVPGYTGADAVKDAPFAAVGCESCHGPGSKHVTAPMAEKAKLMQPLPTQATCVSCHTAAASPKFDFAEAMKTYPHVKKAAAKKS